tara:strand:+ start:1192 stop:1395 length:204 start_codon:yes stop_codon:yes gene_type:complete
MIFKQEALNTFTSKQLLENLNKTFIIHALCNPKVRPQISKYQKQITQTIWKNFPQVAQKEGLKKIQE